MIGMVTFECNSFLKSQPMLTHCISHCPRRHFFQWSMEAERSFYTIKAATADAFVLAQFGPALPLLC